VLEVIDLTVSFGGIRAVDELSFAIGAGELVGLIGPNGAGKTTAVDAVTGFVPHRGRIRLGDDDLTELPAHERARRGLARTWQSLELFDDLTVRENCRVAAERGGWRRFVRELVRPDAPDGRGHAAGGATAPGSDEVRWAIDLVGLGPDVDRHPTELPLGRRKLVAVARALAAGPRVVLLDEPAAGLDTDESRAFGEHLAAVVDHGVSVLLIDHDMGLVLEVCERVLVLDFGRLVAEGPPAEIRRDPRVIDAYLGETHGDAADGSEGGMAGTAGASS
jgi:branched-chain amino acid transport system ATP-binding protein